MKDLLRTVFATEAPPVGMVSQTNLIWVLGETATIPIKTVCRLVGSENVTSIVPLGAADTRVQGAIETVVNIVAAPVLKHSKKNNYNKNHFSKSQK